MIRPKRFGFNPETATSNVFQVNDETNVEAATKEFDTMVDILRAHDVAVEVFDDSAEPAKPDAVFPNNWISFHEDGSVILYPMAAENRRLERRTDVIDALKKKFTIDTIVDLSSHEGGGVFLEGTGSIVFDHSNKIAYACRSVRTNETLVTEVCEKLKYKRVVFDAVDENNTAIYHTNVLMSVGEKFAVVCLDAIKNEEDQERVIESLSDSGHKIIAISYEQMRCFAGNILEVKTRSGEHIVLISETALNSLLPGQVNAITQFSELLPISIPSIEKIGGGGVRCMVAGIHLPVRK